MLTTSERLPCVYSEKYQRHFRRRRRYNITNFPPRYLKDVSGLIMDAFSYISFVHLENTTTFCNVISSSVAASQENSAHIQTPQNPQQIILAPFLLGRVHCRDVSSNSAPGSDVHSERCGTPLKRLSNTASHETLEVNGSVYVFGKQARKRFRDPAHLMSFKSGEGPQVIRTASENIESKDLEETKNKQDKILHRFSFM